MYIGTHQREEWIVLSLPAKSASGAPLDRSLLRRRIRVVLDWLARQGRRGDRVEIRVDRDGRAGWRDPEPGESGPRLEMGAFVTGMISRQEADAMRKALKENPNFVIC
jgi:hypothetical protein